MVPATASEERTMFNRLFPKQIDNSYQGYALAIWLLVPLVLVKLLMGLNNWGQCAGRPARSKWWKSTTMKV